MAASAAARDELREDSEIFSRELHENLNKAMVKMIFDIWLRDTVYGPERHLKIF